MRPYLLLVKLTSEQKIDLMTALDYRASMCEGTAKAMEANDLEGPAEEWRKEKQKNLDLRKLILESEVFYEKVESETE